MTDPLVVILGAGKPYAGTDPTAIQSISGNRRVLDWLIEAFNTALGAPEIHFVGGYRLEDIVDAYPDIHFSRNEDWENSGPVASLFTAPIQADRPIFVCYADTVFESEAVSLLLDGSNVVAVDRGWKGRFHDRGDDSLERAEKVILEDGKLVDADTDLPVEQADGEFIGLVHLSADAVEQAQSLWAARTIDNQDDIPALLRALNATGFDIDAVDINGSWAELESVDDLSQFVLDTKANTLRRLGSMVTESVVLEQFTFTVTEWNKHADDILVEIDSHFDHDRVIVRSSALSEDAWDESNAGRFESILDVPTDQPDALREAIERVIASYTVDNGEDQVLVQPMVTDVSHSGVVMTRTIDTGSPYYVINFDAHSTSTETVTDGVGEHLKTAIVRRDAFDEGPEALDSLTNQDRIQASHEIDLVEILRAVREIETLVGIDHLDIEFAVDQEGTVYLLQSRPMTVHPADESITDAAVFTTVSEAQWKFVQSQTPSPFLLGNRTVFGVMPDWNPAEIIGRRPRRLATSLYRYLIMNDTWATQRAQYGYRDVRPEPLMKCFAGQPYVDVRADFNSFIPASVPDQLAERLVEYYLSRLEAHPEYHDKVEFDIVLTCLTFDFETEIGPLLQAGFTRNELQPLRTGLREITHHAVDRIDDDVAEIDRLAARYDQLMQSELPPLETAVRLLEDCKRYGTLPFAHLARTAFVATALLRSLERKDVLSTEDVNAFLNSLSTVARQFEQDAYLCSNGDITWESFVDRYGHLRPGTYEITSSAYANDPAEYLQPIIETADQPEEHPDPHDVWDESKKGEIEAELEGIGLPPDCGIFIEFLVQAIEGREHSKFVFSKNLSEALEAIAEFGELHGFSREELSHVSIEAFFDLTLDQPATDIESWLETQVRDGRQRHAISQAVELPPLLFDEADFVLFERPTREPNFVTTDTVTTEAIELDGKSIDPEDLGGRIVLIQQADPGYDWLFGHDIAGLITMYGGANSHMAVRAAEFGLPAAIGVGENLFEQLRRGDVIDLDCRTRTLRVVQ